MFFLCIHYCSYCNFFFKVCIVNAQKSCEEGDGLFFSNKFDEAFEKLKQCIIENPNNYVAHFEIGWIYHKIKKDTGMAIYHYAKTLEIRPDYKDAHCYLGQVYESFEVLDSLVKAKGYYEGYCKTEFLRVSTMLNEEMTRILNLAQSNLNQKNFSGAADYILKSLIIEPQNQKANFFNNLLKRRMISLLDQNIDSGNRSYENSDWARAAQFYEQAVKLVNQLRDSYNRLKIDFPDPTLIPGISQKMEGFLPKQKKAIFCNTFTKDNEPTLQNELDRAQAYVNNEEWKYAEEVFEKIDRILQSDTTGCISKERYINGANSLRKGLVWVKFQDLEKKGNYREALGVVKGELTHSKFDLKLFLTYLRLVIKLYPTQTSMILAVIMTLVALMFTIRRKRKIRRWIKEGDSLYNQKKYVEALSFYLMVPTRLHSYFGEMSLRNYLDCYLNMPSSEFKPYSEKFISLLNKTLAPNRISQLNRQDIENLEAIYLIEEKIDQGIEIFKRFSEKSREKEKAYTVFSALCRLYAVKEQPGKVEETTEIWCSSFPDQIDQIINLIKDFEKEYA